MTTTTAANPLEGAAPGDGTPIIETVGLTKTYSGTDFRAVDGLNLQVGSGEVFGLLGPNGAGKTTTIGVLTTRVIPTGGQALIGGIDVVQHPTLVKQLIGVVSQQNTLNSRRSRTSTGTVASSVWVRRNRVRQQRICSIASS
jgi:ABC-type multidrug transport system ATPase subunit